MQRGCIKIGGRVFFNESVRYMQITIFINFNVKQVKNKNVGDKQIMTILN